MLSCNKVNDMHHKGSMRTLFLYQHLESVVNVSLVDSPTNPLYTIVLLAGLPFGLIVASWKNVEYLSSLFASSDLSKAPRHGAVVVIAPACMPDLFACRHPA